MTFVRQAWHALSAQAKVEATDASLLDAARLLWDTARYVYIKPRGMAIRDEENHQALVDESAEIEKRLKQFKIQVALPSGDLALEYQAYHAAMAKASLEWAEKNPPPTLARVIELLDIEQVQQLTLF